VTVEKMKEGLRAARNELLKEILRDYGYVEHLGMGVRNRIIRSMREHNGTEPTWSKKSNVSSFAYGRNPVSPERICEEGT
jgi:predicted HTH transcriptional regulator